MGFGREVSFVVCPLVIASVAAAQSALGAPNAFAEAQLLPARNPVWAGEVFAIDYELVAARRNNPQISPTPEWKPDPLMIEGWSKPDVSEVTSRDERRAKVHFRTRAFAPAAGSFKLEPVSHRLTVQTDNSPGSVVGSKKRMEQLSVFSNQPEIEVRALPAPPDGFSGAVGQFTLTSKIAPLTVAVGEPVTWTLELKGTGNWPAIHGLSEREVSGDFQVVQPRPKFAPATGKQFDGAISEDVVLVPTKTGTYALPGAEFTYFDPATGTYQTTSAAGASVTITEAETPSTGQSAPKSAPKPGLQKVGGQSLRKNAGITDPTLALPEQQLEHVRNQDSPARLFQLMQSGNPPVQNSGKN